MVKHMIIWKMKDEVVDKAAKQPRSRPHSKDLWARSTGFWKCTFSPSALIARQGT